MKLACIFPGQGSQTVGMGLDFYENVEEARVVFEEIDRHAGRALSRLCFQGPEEELRRTINTQPTILSVSLAAWQCFRSLGGPRPAFVAGHSLGEFSALVAAGVIGREAAVKLVLKRAELMESCPPGAMSAVLGVEAGRLNEICRNASSELAQPVIVANYNTREQLVISGDPAAVARAGELARAAGGKVIPLPVGGAFHSPLMAAAAAEFEQELGRYDFSRAEVPVVQNFDARPGSAASEIKSKLSRQMPSSVRWCESIEFMLSPEQGVDTFVEIGPGKALAGMVKKIDRAARVFNVYDVATLKTTLEALKALEPVA